MCLSIPFEDCAANSNKSAAKRSRSKNKLKVTINWRGNEEMKEGTDDETYMGLTKPFQWQTANQTAAPV